MTRFFEEAMPRSPWPQNHGMAPCSVGPPGKGLSVSTYDGTVCNGCFPESARVLSRHHFPFGLIGAAVLGQTQLEKDSSPNEVPYLASGCHGRSQYGHAQHRQLPRKEASA